MSTRELRQKIKQLNLIDLDLADYKYLVSRLWSASKGVSVPIFPSPSTELYFRARICNSKKITQAAELGAPPAELVKGYQRCNPPGIPMFYAASKRITALLECEPNEDDIVYLGQWINTKPVPLNRVLVPLDDIEMLETSQLDTLFHSYLETLFTRRIHKTFSNAYKITAAAAEVLTTNYISDALLGVHEDRTVGLIYPSVANISSSYNMALHAEFATKRLQLLHVTQLRILKKTEKNFIIDIVDTANEIEGGQIKWLNNGYSIPKPIANRSRLEFNSNGRAWVVPICDTPPTAEEIDDFLNE